MEKIKWLPNNELIMNLIIIIIIINKYPDLLKS